MLRKRLIKWSLGIVALTALLEIGLRVGLGFGTPVLSSRDPACGYLFTPNQNVVRFGATNHINSQGMRCDEVAAVKPTDTYRIMCVGDSVTYGTTYVDQPKIYTSRLHAVLSEQTHKNVEVLNASAGGWAPANEVGFLASRGTYQSDLVILCLNPTDITGDFNPGRFGMEVGQPETRPLLAIQELAVRYILPRVRPLFSKFTTTEEAGPPAIKPTLEQNEAGMIKQIEAAKTIANHSGAAFAIIYTPARPGGAELDNADIHAGHDFLVAWTKHNNVPMVDATSAFATLPAKEVFQDEIHIRDKGHELITQEVTKQWIELTDASLLQTQKSSLASNH